MTVYKVEVEQRYQATFYVEADNYDQAGEIGSEVAETIDLYDWEQHGFEDVDVWEVALGDISGRFSERRGRKFVTTGELLAKEVAQHGIWVGGTKGGWWSTLDYPRPEDPPAPDPNQGTLL